MTNDERFDMYVSEPDDNGHRLWTGTVLNGYGVININGKLIRAHRYAWARRNNGMIPISANINHRCNVKLCVTYEHLYAGSQKDNMQDRLQSGEYMPRRRRMKWERGMIDLL